MCISVDCICWSGNIKLLLVGIFQFTAMRLRDAFLRTHILQQGGGEEGERLRGMQHVQCRLL